MRGRGLIVGKSPSTSFVQSFIKIFFWASSCGFLLLALNRGALSGPVLERGEPQSITLSQAEPQSIEPPRAMWVWDVKIAADEDATNRLLDFCQEKNINLLYYSAYKVSGSRIEVFRKFNRRAHEKGVSVQALAGDPRWCLARYHFLALDWVSSVLEYNRNCRPKERFDGLHSDVEPYLMSPKLWEEKRAQLLKEYLDMNQKIMELIEAEARAHRVKGPEGKRILFAVDIPFWYDDDRQMWVEWKGRYDPPSYHILDTVDSITVMDYRNFAEGANGSIALVSNEIDYADKIGKKVYIGQETKTDVYPEYITFGGTNIEYMESEIRKLVDAYIDHPSFAGIAIHHYLSYKRLIRKGKMSESTSLRAIPLAANDGP